MAKCKKTCPVPLICKMQTKSQHTGGKPQEQTAKAVLDLISSREEQKQMKTIVTYCLISSRIGIITKTNGSTTDGEERELIYC